jgi:hypothetical protein
LTSPTPSEERQQNADYFLVEQTIVFSRLLLRLSRSRQTTNGDRLLYESRQTADYF